MEMDQGLMRILQVSWTLLALPSHKSYAEMHTLNLQLCNKENTNIPEEEVSTVLRLQ